MSTGSTDPAPRATATAPARRRSWTIVRAAAGLLLVASLAVAAGLYWPDVVAALAALREPSPPWLVAAVVAELASMGWYARMQRRLLRGAGTTVPLRRAVRLAYAAHSMSITLPGGPLVSTVYNYRRMRAFGADSAVAAWATAASGVLSGLGLVGLAVATAVAGGLDEGEDVLTTAVVVGAGALALAGWVLARRAGWSTWLTGPVAAVRDRLSEKNARRLEFALAWTGRLLRVRIPPRDLAMAGGHSVLNWLADAGCFGLCCLALGVDVRPIPLALTYLAGMTASGLPIIPGGIGTVDGALMVGLVAGGVAASPALAVVVLYRLITFALIGAIGWLVWLWERKSPRDLAPAPERLILGP